MAAPASTAAALFFDADAIASLAFADVATVSVYGKLSLWDDGFCPPESQLGKRRQR